MKPENAVTPSYQWVQETIRQRILSGEWPCGGQIPTERELQKEFSLSRVTISKGLANLVNEGLLVRRQGHGTFVAEGCDIDCGPRIIKYVSPVSKDGVATIRHGVLEALHDVASGKGYETGIDFYRDPEEQIRQLRRDSDAYHTGFLIFFEPGNANIEELKRLKDSGFPFVLIDAYPPELDVDCVVTDSIEGGQTVVEYLARLGHRDIVYITRPIDRSSLSDRLSGFLRGLVLCDLPFSHHSVIKLEHAGAAAISELKDAVSELMARPEKPSAIFLSNDDLAMEAIDYLQSIGVRVPQDISVVGYDNIDSAANATVPLTTVAQDYYEMAREAANLLMSKIEKSEDRRPAQIRIKPSLIERSSTQRV